MSPAKDVASGDMACVKAAKLKKGHVPVCSEEASELLFDCAELARVHVR